MALSDVTETTIKRWVKGMHEAGAKAKTIKNKHEFLSGALNEAVASRRIERSPCAHTSSTAPTPTRWCCSSAPSSTSSTDR